MKKTFLLISLMLSSQAFAGELPLPRVAVAQAEKVMAESTANQQAKKELEAKHGEYQKLIEKKETDLRKQQEDLVAKEKTMAPAEFEKKRQEFEKKVLELQNNVADKKKELEAAYMEAMGKINTVVQKVVEDVAKKHNVNMILQREQMIFADPALDVSQEIITALNKELPKVEVKFGAAKK